MSVYQLLSGGIHPEPPEKWWAHLGSNQGPTGYEPVALPIELWALAIQEISPLLNHAAGCLCYTD